MGKIQDPSKIFPRALSVVVLADVSDSMALNGKIEALNAALSAMLRRFATEDVPL